jgi:hypothetical protein
MGFLSKSTAFWVSSHNEIIKRTFLKIKSSLKCVCYIYLCKHETNAQKSINYWNWEYPTTLLGNLPQKSTMLEILKRFSPA